MKMVNKRNSISEGNKTRNRSEVKTRKSGK